MAGNVPVVQSEAALAESENKTEGRVWVRALRSTGADRDRAVAELYKLLLRAARFELSRRPARLHAVRGETFEDLAVQSADNALTAILAKLDDYRYESRFTTWAYKFVILEAAVTARRRAWQERELPMDPRTWSACRDGKVDPAGEVIMRERLREVAIAIQEQLSPHQREVLTALVLADVPIDVLAERLNTSRGALYKTLHDARRKLRAVIDPDHDDEP
jgi:RNA polymerase sigma-70 factor, ECF subfamily